MNEWATQFCIELKFRDIMAYLSDARLIAIEREYLGIARLVDVAISDLDLIGKLTGINGQRRIEGEIR